MLSIETGGRENPTYLPAGSRSQDDDDTPTNDPGLCRLVEARTLPACVIRVEKLDGRIDYRFLAVSPAFAEATGLDDALGRSMRELCPEHEEYWFELYQRVASTGEPTSFEHRAKALDSAFRGFAFRVGHPEDSKVAVVFENLREESRLALFGATLAHELRGPIAPIATGTHVLKSLASDIPQAQNIIAMMERQLVQLKALIDDLMDVGSLRARKVRADSQRVNLHHVISASVETCAPALDSRYQELRIESQDEPLFVRGDVRRLTQVFINLLTNSNKYTPAGGHIVIRLARADGFARVEVRDDGVGIAIHDLPHIFDLFMQGPSHRFEPQRGLGIGLAVVRNIVELHGGSVTAHSEGAGRGSVFTVSLPIDA